MSAYIARRLGTTVLVAVGISIAVFMIIRLIPGDPARVMLGIHADASRIATLRTRLGLDQPIPVQYGMWIGGALRGDLGQSVLTGQPVSEAILQRIPVSFSLAGGALLVALLIALPAGIFAAVRRQSWGASSITVLSQIGVAIPDFWLGIMLILVFGEWLRLLPPSGYVSPGDSLLQWLRHLALPTLSIGLISGAILTRFVRSSMLEVLGEEYVKVARSKGVREVRVITRHTLRNALIPILTVTGMQLAYLLSGVVVIEVVFALPGLGRLAFDAVARRDYPMLQGAVLIIAISFALINLAVDILYAYIDPRIKY